MFGDRSQVTPLSAAAFARTQAKVVADLPAVFETVRIDQLARDQLVAQLAFADKELLGRGRSQGRFQGRKLALGQRDDVLPDLELRDDPGPRRRRGLAGAGNGRAGICASMRCQLAALHRGGGGD